MKDYLKRTIYQRICSSYVIQKDSAKNSHYGGVEKLRVTGGAQLLGPVFKCFVDISLKICISSLTKY